MVYEWNLPTGTTCPFATECKVIVDRLTGKFNVHKGAYRCYAANAERFPGVREHRWRNFEFVKNGGIPVLPKDCKNVRIHMSGDFFSQAYFDMWVELARNNPDVNFWAFTKSIIFWVNRINDIPSNLILTASYGGKYDNLIDEYKLKNCKVFKTVEECGDLPIDQNDDYARLPNVNFALLDNFAVKKKSIKC